MGIRRNSFYVFLTSCLMVAIQFATQAVLARALGPDARGGFAVCWTFLNLLLIFGIFGVSDANTYRIASSKATISQAFGASVWIAILGWLIIGFSAYGIIHLPLTFFSKASGTEFLLSIIAVGPWVLSIYLIAILRGMFSYKLMNITNLFGASVSLVSVYIFCFLFKLGVKGALIGRTVPAIFVITLVTLKLLPHLVFKDLREGFRQILGTLHYAFRSFFGFFAQTMSVQVGVLVMASYLGKAEVGFYAIALTMVLRILMIPTSLRTVVMPELARQNTADGALVCRSLRIMLPIVALAAAGMALFCNPFIRYGFGKEYLPVLPAIYVLLIGVVFKTASNFVTSYLQAINRPGTSSAIRLLCVFINIILLLLFVRPYGLIGCCAATVLSYILEALIMISIFMRISGTKSWRSLLLQKNDIAYLHDSVCSLVGWFKPRA